MTTYKVADLMKEMEINETTKFGIGNSTTSFINEIVQVGKLYHVKGDSFECTGDENLMLSVTRIEESYTDLAPCDVCGSTNICCGTPFEGLCVQHCHNHQQDIWDGKSSGGRVYERGE